ncbi:MAG: hypothetical protein DMD96_26445 [Candidatus Rokuibacteriota bacterium]|nr:MAG: hypothetical protein DMD96_26445 [Candidatus Rokubacteria bacterium]
MLPAASRAVTVSTFEPGCSTIPLAVQFVVPVAVPLPPRLFDHVTWVTPMLSDAVPPIVSGVALALKVPADAGDVMATVGATVSVPVPVPVTRRVRVSPSALKLTLTLAVAAVVGVKRTVTACVDPAPPRLKEAPDTMLKGAEVDTVPETTPPRAFCTVKVWSAKLPRFTFPKPTLPDGVTEKSVWATPFPVSEQALSLPPRSTALTETKYWVPLVNRVSLKLTVVPDAGLDVGDAT